MKFVSMVLALVALTVTLAAVAPAQAQARGPWRTEAWCEAKVKRVHYWRHIRVRGNMFGACIGWDANAWSPHYNRNGEQMYRLFAVMLSSVSGWRTFSVTMHTTWTPLGFYLTPGDPW